MYRVQSERPSLLWEPISDHHITVKLSNMRSALAKGADPNELDGLRMPRWGRPLNYAILDAACINYASLKENFPVVELLLASGADPRLSTGIMKSHDDSPLEELRSWLQKYEVDGETWYWQERELKPMYERAYAAMKAVAARLNAQDEVERNGGSLEKIQPQTHGSIFYWLKFW